MNWWIILFIKLIPGAILIYQALGCFFVRRNEIVTKIFLLVSCSLLSGMVIQISDWINILWTLGIFMAAVLMGCQGSLLKRIAVGPMFASTVLAFNALMDNFVWPFWDRQPFIERVVFAAAFYLLCRHFSPGKDLELTSAMWRLLLLLTATPMGIIFSVVLFTYSEQPRDTFQHMFLLLLALFSFAGLLWTVTVLSRQRMLEEAQTAADMNSRYYAMMEKQNLEIRRLKHDLTNHMQVLSALPAEQKDAYIRELLDNSVLYQTLKYCNDDIVNVILSTKASAMGMYGIDFHVKAEIQKPLPLEKTDICAVFGNALDNAVEYVCRLEQDMRYINLEARLGRGMFVLKVVNPCMDVVSGDELPPTTKQDKEAHGLGLKSIRQIAEKYDGRLELRTEGGEFIFFFYCKV
ncbi:GHKL domain-containing protein [Blautia schinkii]|nr:GHKL domain-containing protein [Blautia schinkii]